MAALVTQLYQNSIQSRMKRESESLCVLNGWLLLVSFSNGSSDERAKFVAQPKMRKEITLISIFPFSFHRLWGFYLVNNSIIYSRVFFSFYLFLLPALLFAVMHDLGEHIQRMPAGIPARSGAQNACLYFHAWWHDLPTRRSGPWNVHHSRRNSGSH